MPSRVGKLSPTFLLLAVGGGWWESQWSRVATSPRRLFRVLRGSLRAKFILVIVSLQIVVMGAVAVVMEHYQRQAIIEQAQLRALSLATSLAALAEGYLLGYNYIKLEQAVEKVTADEPDVAYAAAHLHDGRVAAFSWRDDLQGKILDDPVSQRVLQATTRWYSISSCRRPALRATTWPSPCSSRGAPRNGARSGWDSPCSVPMH
jgi:hypothetical protein